MHKLKLQSPPELKNFAIRRGLIGVHEEESLHLRDDPDAANVIRPRELQHTAQAQRFDSFSEHVLQGAAVL